MFVSLFIIGLNKNKYMIRSLFSLVLLTLLSVSSFAQKNAILGSIVDQKQQPLAGVSVSLQGTVRGVQSDQSGNYILKDIYLNDITYC
jgi:Fe(3+) dicitrate transport protein